MGPILVDRVGHVSSGFGGTRHPDGSSGLHSKNRIVIAARDS
jgi:hypothetical protein